MIRKAWQEQRDIKEVMLFLQGHGVSASYATKVFKHYGRESIRLLRENPYRLATDIFGIGFVSADRIAEKIGGAEEWEVRAEAGVLYVLQQMTNDGHVYSPYGLLVEECMKVLGIGRDIVLKAMGKIDLKKSIVIEDINNDDEIKENSKAVYLTNFYVSETGIADNLKRLLGSGKVFRQFDMEGLQKELGITLAEEQSRAVRESIGNKVSVITGGPGTGKTTIVNFIIRIYEGLGLGVLLAAPTGRASKRMAEATGHEAKTIHRMLEFNPREWGFRRDEGNPLEADLIVVDEASMVDTMLMHQFLRAVPDDASLVFVGDVDQLPSVGAGNVLKDIIDSGKFTTVRLKEIFRQSRQSVIITNAHRVNNGDMPALAHDKDGQQDFYFFQTEEPERIVEQIIRLCKEKIPERFGFDPVKDIQVLTAMHKGLLGTSNLNAELQRALNPSTGGLARGSRFFRKGDKVMQVVNNYDKDIFNGDIGVLKNINKEDHEITVDYDGRAVAYDYKELDEITHAYAISVHKSQGSEYPAVVMPVHTQHFVLLQRNLLYTGITRGKEAVRNNKPLNRHTHLKNRLVLL
jgi:exodeoxyribonuclease V alpha subunit